MIPLRLIGTQDEEIIQSVIHATNRQTEIKSEQFFAITEFSKKLELFFQTFPNGRKLFYERRTHQYDSLAVEKRKIVTPENLIRAFAAMFLNEPHRTTRNFGALKAKLGGEIFAKEHRLEPYYVSAFALFKLEQLFRSQKLDAKYKPARFQILLAFRLLANPPSPPKMNSHEMERYCAKISEQLWDSAKAEKLMLQATSTVESVARGNFDRDNIRTQPFTEKIIQMVYSFFKTKNP